MKDLLPGPVRNVFGWLNQKLFARRTLRRKYGDWFEVDWRKKYQTLSDMQWRVAYDIAWRNHGNDCLEETDVALILRMLGSKGSVLDVGCGAGSLAVRLAEEGYQVTGLDVSAEALRLAEERAKQSHVAVSLTEGFAELLPYQDHTFDYVTCCHTLEHVRDLPAAIAEFKRVARRKIVVLVPQQAFKMYMDNYHTQFFETKEKLVAAIGLKTYRCEQIDCSDHRGEFRGKAFLYAGDVSIG